MKRFVPLIIFAVAVALIAPNWVATQNGEERFRFHEIRQNPGPRRRPHQTAGHRRAQFAPDHSRQTGRCVLKAAAGERDAVAHRRRASMLPLPISIQYSLCKTQTFLACSAGNKATGNILALPSLSPFLKKIDEQGEQSDKLESVQRSAFQKRDPESAKQALALSATEK